jgi:hypothetical protein
MARPSRASLKAALFLVVSNVLVYIQAVRFGFVFDDGQYIGGPPRSCGD